MLEQHRDEDAAERSRATRSVRANQEWLDPVTEATSEGIYDWSVATSDLKVSYRLTAMLGLSPGDLSASDWNERIHGDDFGRYRGKRAVHFKGATRYLEGEYRKRRESGEYVWFSDRGKCVRDETGRAARLQNHAETGGIVLSGETHALVKDEISALDQGEITLKGMPRPVRAFKVVGIHDELVDTGEVVRLDQPGMHLLVNPDEMTEESSAEALEALERAAARIKQRMD